jgi:hypothetical protein
MEASCGQENLKCRLTCPHGGFMWTRKPEMPPNLSSHGAQLKKEEAKQKRKTQQSLPLLTYQPLLWLPKFQ